MNNKTAIICCLVIIFIVSICLTPFILNSSHSDDYNVTLEGMVFSIPGDYVAGPIGEQSGDGYHIFEINCTDSNGNLINIQVGKNTIQGYDWRNNWRDSLLSEGFSITTLDGIDGYIYFYSDGVAFWYVSSNLCIDIFAKDEQTISNIVKYW